MFFVSERSAGPDIKRKPFGLSSAKQKTKTAVSDLISGNETRVREREREKKAALLRRLYISRRNGSTTANDHQSRGVCSTDRETSVLYTANLKPPSPHAAYAPTRFFFSLSLEILKKKKKKTRFRVSRFPRSRNIHAFARTRVYTLYVMIIL